MKILTLSADGFEDIELFYPYYRFKEDGHDVVLATPQKKQITGKMGYSVKPDAAMSGHNVKNYDALFLPGGKAPETVRLDSDAVRITKQFMDAGKPVAAICHGIQILISADAIRGRNVTSWPALQDDARAAGAKWHDREVVVDDNLVTSRMPNDLPAFCREFFKVLHAAAAHEKPARIKRPTRRKAA